MLTIKQQREALIRQLFDADITEENKHEYLLLLQEIEKFDRECV